MRAVGCMYVCVHACDKDWHTVPEANSLRVAVLLMCLSCLPSVCDVTETVWRGMGSAHHFVAALTYPSIHPPILASITCLSASALRVEHHDTICSYCPLAPFTDKGPGETHRDEFPPPVGPNPSTTAPYWRQHPPRQSFKGTGVTDIQIHTIFMTVICIFTQGLCFRYTKSKINKR